MTSTNVLITNDAIVLGILISVLGLIFYTTSLRIFEKFYKIVPSILLCFFIPGLLSSFKIISAETSSLDEVASKFFLPICLVFFTLSIDFQAIRRLGGKALFVFFAGAIGVMLGGPLGLIVAKSINPNFLNENGEEVWRGLATIAGSWTGGNANQIALKEIFQPSPTIFAQTSVIDVVFAELWLGVLLFFISKSEKIDALFKANNNEIYTLKEELDFHVSKQQNPTLHQLFFLFSIGFGVTAIAHFFADLIVPFIEANYPNLKAYSLGSKSFWIVLIASSTGIGLSFTKFRKYENYGASKFGTLFLYFLIATIGIQLNIFDAFKNPMLFLIGIIWIFTHAIFVVIASRISNSPFFFTAIGSQANVGGVASTSVVAAAFHPSLAPIGVLLAILGNVIGTPCGYLTGLVMQWISK